MTAFGADTPDPEAKSSAPIKRFSVWCQTCKKLAGHLVGGNLTRVECECHNRDKAHTREKMGLPVGAEIPPWGDPRWGLVFAGSSGGSFGQVLAEVVRDAHRDIRQALPAPAPPEPEPEAALAEAVPEAEAPIPAPALEVPPEAEPDFTEPEEGLPAAESGGQPEAASEASPEGLE